MSASGRPTTRITEIFRLGETGPSPHRSALLARLDWALPRAIRAGAASDLLRARVLVATASLGGLATGCLTLLVAAARGPTWGAGTGLTALALVVLPHALRWGLPLGAASHLAVGGVWLVPAALALVPGAAVGGVTFTLVLVPALAHLILGGRGSAGWSAITLATLQLGAARASGWIPVLAGPPGVGHDAATFHVASVLTLLAWGAIVAADTLRVETQRDLEAVKARLSAMAENASDLICELDSAGTCLYANRAAEALFGLPRAQLIGGSYALLLEPSERERFGQFLQPSRRSRADFVHRAQDRLRTLECGVGRYRDRDGRDRTILVARDVTESTEARERLAQSERRLRRMIGTAPAAIVTMDGTGAVVDWNPHAETLFGFAADEVVGRPLAGALVPADQRAAHAAGLARYVETGEAAVLGSTLELEGLHRDGSRVPIELRIADVGSPDEPLFLGMAVGVAERALAEGLRRNLLSVVSHELRTPLTAIQTALSMLSDGLSGEGAKHLAIASRNSDRLLRLVNDLLDAESLRRGAVKLSFEAVDPEHVVEQAVEANLAFCAGLGVQLCRSGSVGDVSIYVDPNRLLQVLTNLVSNAARFTGASGDVEVGATSRGDGRVELYVKDRGPGIPAGIRDTMFEPFVQGDRSAAPAHRGTGLGLSIAHELTHRMGGTLRHEPRPGGGSIFTVDLPVWRA